MVDIKTILAKAVEDDASDVHINVGMEPLIRKNTKLIKMDFPVPSQGWPIALSRACCQGR